ncbi:MAG: response regulator [Candidatus Marinimicrobia bacterium]|nr:response regulator [Candidatus Neomarinimicrobiota bacterium]
MAKKVLIIDDDFDLVEAMRSTLEAAGYEVIDAQDGDKGLEKIRAETPDLVILDVMMSSMDEGFHVAYKIREDNAIKDTPIVMLTAVGNQTGFQFDPGKDADFLPVDAFLEKPVNPKNLVDVVHQHIKA